MHDLTVLVIIWLGVFAASYAAHRISTEYIGATHLPVGSEESELFAILAGRR
ncbi:hypothetical protein LCGC14_1817510 [marine sediment metagenome]|uniref:Uncharacterized protein n=1 Tax=marine sediment metagenome TaxID=412755 RepID=A0A0F9JJF5_9ZZZZ